MTEDQPRDEALMDGGFTPWTEEELAEIFAQMDKAILIRHLQDDFDHTKTISTKKITYDGTEYECVLTYVPPDATDDDYSIIPYPDRSSLIIENKIGEEPTVQFPVTLDFAPTASPVNTTITSLITLPDTFPITHELTFDNVGSMDISYIDPSGKRATYLFLPAEPQLIASVKINPTQEQSTTII